MMSEPTYEPRPTCRADWLYLESRGVLSSQIHPGSTIQPHKVVSSLDHLALIDETLASDSFSRLGPGAYVHAKTLLEGQWTAHRWKTLGKLERCSRSQIAFAPKAHGTVAEESRVRSVVLAPMCCHCRACALCQRRRRSKLRRVFQQRIKAMERPKLLTLTIKHNDASLKDQCHRLKEAFRRLRARAVWKQQVKGGYWVLEIKRSNADGLWHVHIHAVIDSKYVPQEWLSDEWKRITGDSCIVDIRVCKPSVASYLSKYLTKGSELKSDGDVLWTLYESLHRTRDTNRFGTCHDAPSESSGLMYLGVVSSILGRARSGNPEALWLLEGIERELLWKIREREFPL